MEAQFQFILDQAKRYKRYSADDEGLLDALNFLPKETLADVYKEYGDPESNFRPVNILRAEIARQLLEGKTVTGSLVEEIKEKIRKKDTGYFKHIGEGLLKALVEYPVANRDMFANWQRLWPVFHPFFYRGQTLETTRLYLDQLSIQLLNDLELETEDFHWVDFYGASNFGDTMCWIALYPCAKNSHKDAYQFFVNLSSAPQAGRMAGHSLKAPIPDQLKAVSSYAEVVEVFAQQKSEIQRLNNHLKSYYKFAPGSQASEWESFHEQGIIAINYSGFDLGDISSFTSHDDIKAAVGLPSEDQSNQTWNIWLFKTANVGDVVFANKGVNTCIGVGIIEGEYYFSAGDNLFKHRRKVNWITDKVYQYKGNLKGYKTLFRPDTFSPTKVWQFLLDEYVRTYPELTTVFNYHGLAYNTDGISVGEPPQPPVADSPLPYDEEGAESKRPLQFWWLNANPNIWKISTHAEGQKQRYTTHNDKGNKRRIYKYFREVKPGDLVIGYETTPVKQIKAIYEISKGIHSTNGVEEIEFTLNEKLEVPVDWADLKNNKGLESCEVMVNNQGSLYRLTEEEFDIIRELIDLKNIAVEKEQTKELKYNFNEDPDRPFIPEDDFRKAVSLLKRKKNIILQGPPGVGKTFIARKIAYDIMGKQSDFNIQAVQFHQSYSYEDFIQGLRPTTKGFELRDGIFYTFCRRAAAHPDRPFFFIIDEINRGNLSKIFGELLMLIEADKRSDKYNIKLTYAEDDSDQFHVPENIYIIGTMNTADRSLAIIDYALRRRFAFISLVPEYGNNFVNFLLARGISKDLVSHVCESVTTVNKHIVKDRNLGEGFQIGHSYFCTYAAENDERHWWKEVLTYELRPLLEEIWFDDGNKVNEMLNLLKRD